MAMGRRKTVKQESMWIETARLARRSGHVFYECLNRLLAEHDFDPFVETLCHPFYAETMGRPGLAPGIYFRLLLIGYFEGIDSERGIAWRAADSLALQSFLGLSLEQDKADHSTLSRTRRLIGLEAHQAFFNFVLRILAGKDLLKGLVVGVDATHLEANAALRSIVRRDSGEKYEDFLRRLAQESGIETPTREEMAKLDRKRPKKGSNQDWAHPHDPDARIAKMKDGSTHLAHKAEHAVDLETGAVLAVTIQAADAGDVATGVETLMEAAENVIEVAVATNNETVGERVSLEGPKEVVADKGYHSNAMLVALGVIAVRSYISEPHRGRRCWRDKAKARRAVYGNRRRIRGRHGRALMRRRSELVERSFAHVYETGRMRRVWLRGRQNILKRVLIQNAGLNLGLVMRQLIGKGTPRGFQGRMVASRAANEMRVEMQVWLFVIPRLNLMNLIDQNDSVSDWPVALAA